MAIRHSVSLIEYLQGLGTTKSQVLPDLVQFDDEVKMTLDLGASSGRPMGPPTTAGLIYDGITVTATEFLLLRLDGPGGGAILSGVIVDSTTAAAYPDGWEINNYQPTPVLYGNEKIAPNAGTRQFDQLGLNPSNARVIEPFGSVRVSRKVIPALPSVAGVDRSFQFLAPADTYVPLNVFIPPGETGLALHNRTANAAAVDVRFSFFFEPLPLSGTGMPRG
jgi:hypothetical protein